MTCSVLHEVNTKQAVITRGTILSELTFVAEVNCLLNSALTYIKRNVKYWVVQRINRIN